MTAASPGSAPRPAGHGRMVWLDANRFFAALGVVLIHSTADTAGQAFSQAPPAERVVPVLLRCIAEFSGSEMFFVFSLFLLALKLDKRNLVYGQTVAENARRLLVPFVVWTVFYAFFRLAKAGAFGYTDAILGQLADWRQWVAYFTLGSAQYHLHFLPTLFCLILFYPVMRSATRYPLAGLGVIGTLAAMDFVNGWLWGNVADPMLRDYLLRFVKTLGYVGYGLAAFSLYGIWQRGIGREDSRLLFRLGVFAAVIAFGVSLVWAAQVIATGIWVTRVGPTFWAHFLMPLTVILAFMGTQYQGWSPRFTWLARFTFGVYLIHPVFIDLYDIAVTLAGLTLNPTVMVVTKYAIVAPLSVFTSMQIARVGSIAWLIGLGPLPLGLEERLRPARAALAK